jgi:uncharacterized protein (TIRG00374 family)
MNGLRVLLRVGVGIAISAVSTYLVTKAISVDDTMRVIGRARWEGVAVVFGLLLVDVAIRGLRWRALLTPLAVISRPTVLAHLLVGYLANNALPARLGEFVRSFSLGDREGVGRSAVIGSVLVERLLDVGVLAVAVFVGLAFVTSTPVLPVAALTGLAVGLAGLLILLSVGGSGRHMRWLDRVPAGAVRSMVHGLIQGVSVIRSGAVLAEALVLTAAAWSVTTFAFAVAGAAVGIELTIPEALLFAAAVNLATAIPAGPGYIGTFELAAVSVAAAIGISTPAGLAMAVIVHAATLVLTTVGGIGALGLLYLNLEGSMARRASEGEPALAVAMEVERPNPHPLGSDD